MEPGPVLGRFCLFRGGRGGPPPTPPGGGTPPGGDPPHPPGGGGGRGGYPPSRGRPGGWGPKRAMAKIQILAFFDQSRSLRSLGDDPLRGTPHSGDPYRGPPTGPNPFEIALIPTASSLFLVIFV